MDKIFMLQKAYLDERFNMEGVILSKLIKDFECRNLDKHVITDDSTMEYYTCLKEVDQIVPVGNIDFVRGWLKKTLGSDKMEPIEVPESLREFTGRFYKIMDGSEITHEMADGDFFIKDASELKRWNNLLYKGVDVYNKIEPDRKYVVSEWINFVAEYRVFVFDDEVMACQHYLGDALRFPNGGTIDKMVKAYKKQERPRAYTLDIGLELMDDGSTWTEIIEVHPFVSCGLYGFCDEKILPMLTAGFDWYKQQILKEKQRK